MTFDPARQIHYRECKYCLSRLYQIQTSILPAMTISTEWVGLSTTGLLSISAGFAWDGPSGPTQDTPDTLRASLVHDALYDLLRRGLIGMELRATVDRLLRDILKEDQIACGILPDDGRADLWLAGVRLFAEGAAMAGGGDPVLVAPRDYIRVGDNEYRD